MIKTDLIKELRVNLIKKDFPEYNRCDLCHRIPACAIVLGDGVVCCFSCIGRQRGLKDAIEISEVFDPIDKKLALIYKDEVFE